MQPGKQGTLGYIGGDNIGKAAKPAHALHKFRAEYGIKTAVIAQYGIHNYYGTFFLILRKKPVHDIKLAERAEKSAVNGIKIYTERTPMIGDRNNIVRKVAVGISRKAARMR